MCLEANKNCYKVAAEASLLEVFYKRAALKSFFKTDTKTGIDRLLLAIIRLTIFLIGFKYSAPD